MTDSSPIRPHESAPQTPTHSQLLSSSSLLSPSSSPSPLRNPDDVDAEELTALIQAIKFAHPEFGVKRVHDQVVTHGGKYARVPFKRVKRYLHKLGIHSPSDDERNEESVCRLMTIGGLSKSNSEDENNQPVTYLDPSEEMVWLPVKLDEPASKLDDFPYQAVIRMTTNESGDAEGALGEIYKIQVAMEADGSFSTIHPMLVYNKARSRKTFLHPDSPAYLPVQRVVTAQGSKGAVGGWKAYFWGRYFKIEDMLYLNSEKIAPAQQW